MTEETLVRKAESRDLEDIVAIIKDAKALLKAQNSSQWQEGYPNRASIEEDLDNRAGFYLKMGKSPHIWPRPTLTPTMKSRFGREVLPTGLCTASPLRRISADRGSASFC